MDESEENYVLTAEIIEDIVWEEVNREKPRRVPILMSIDEYEKLVKVQEDE